MTDASLVRRIASLERSARRERIVALGLLVFALTVAASPASPPTRMVHDAHGTATLGADGITFTDAANRRRLHIGIDTSGYPSADFFDAAGTIRQSMYLLTDRPVFRQFDKEGHRRAELFLASDTQNGEFVIRDGADVTRAAAFIGDKGLPEFGVYGSDGKVRAYLSADDDGAYLVMKDGNAVSRVVVGAYTTGKFGMDVRDKNDAAVWSAP